MLALTFFAATAHAQTLAHRNWSGNGLTSVPWWQDAIFYRIDVDSFQDSDGDGKGDLAGVAQRLSYLHSIGVDAILLHADHSDEHFDELVRAANNDHLRAVVGLGAGGRDVVAEARSWLSHGAAGVAIDGSDATGGLAPPLDGLHRLLQSFPGDRVLLVFPQGAAAPAEGAQLVADVARFPAPLLAQPRTGAAMAPPNSRPLLLSQPGMLAIKDRESRDKIAAARLLLRPGAALLSFGEEVGMNSAGDKPHDQPVMSWTPTNLTAGPKVEEPQPASTAPDPATYNASNYTGYKPYVAPKAKPKPVAPGTPPDPATLPGFSTKPGADLSPNIATANVATEDANPLSLLNFYRRLAQLHHDHPALRGGELTDIDLSAQMAMAWVIKAPAATRTARNIVVVANFSDKPQTLDLDANLVALRLKHGGLRPLLASWTASPPFQYSNKITLPPFSVLAAEL